MRNEEKKQSWWSTVPGTITAIATLITAVGGLIVILQSLGVFSNHADAGKLPVQSSDPTSPKPATIHLQSTLIIRYPYSYDLDAGVPYRTGESNAEVDFVWEHPTSMDFEIRPDLCKFNLLGKVNFDEIDLPYLEKLQYSKEPINADLLLKGTVIGVITKEKRFGKFIVEKDDLEPTINVIIYERDE